MKGGTGIVSYGDLASFVCSDVSGMDTTGLARWSYMMFFGWEGHVTMVLVSYNPSPTAALHTSSSYHLQKAYFTMAEKDMTCPRRCFKMDLITIIKQWHSDGHHIIVCLDMNDHVYHTRLGHALVDSDDLDLRETILSHSGQHLTATYFCGSKPIDAVWATPDVDITNACTMPVGYSIGDHRVFIIDFSTSSLVGINPQLILRPAARQLNTKILNCAEAYNHLLEAQLIRYWLIDKLQHAHRSCPTQSGLQNALAPSIRHLQTVWDMRNAAAAAAWSQAASPFLLKLPCGSRELYATELFSGFGQAR